MKMTLKGWGELALDPGQQTSRTFGALSLELRREANEVWVRGSYRGVAPVDDDWIRWSLHGDDRLAVRPSRPDRLVVVSPERPFFLPPRGRARVFVRIPLFVRLTRVDDHRIDDTRLDDHQEGTVLEEFPSIVLSDTWWGTFTEGELAYWVGTTARRTVTEDVIEPHFAICPFDLVNESAQALPVERFAVRVAALTLFGRDKAVWTDEVLVRYHGPHETSSIQYTGGPPPEAGDVERIADPREQASKALHGRTFSRLLNLSSGW